MGGQNNPVQSGHGQPGQNGHRTGWNNQFGQQNNQMGNNQMITNHNQVSTNPTEPKSEPNQIKTEPAFPNFNQPSPANPGLGPGVVPKTEPPSKSPIQIKTEPTNQNDRNVNSVEIRSNISSEDPSPVPEKKIKIDPKEEPTPSPGPIKTEPTSSTPTQSSTQASSGDAPPDGKRFKKWTVSELCDLLLPVYDQVHSHPEAHPFHIPVDHVAYGKLIFIFSEFYFDFRPS